eukprot:3896027-Amphidinium_carterae.1
MNSYIQQVTLGRPRTIGCTQGHCANMKSQWFEVEAYRSQHHEHEVVTSLFAQALPLRIPSLSHFTISPDIASINWVRPSRCLTVQPKEMSLFEAPV